MQNFLHRLVNFVFFCVLNIEFHIKTSGWLKLNVFCNFFSFSSDDEKFEKEFPRIFTDTNAICGEFSLKLFRHI